MRLAPRKRNGSFSQVSKRLAINARRTAMQRRLNAIRIRRKIALHQTAITHAENNFATNPDTPVAPKPVSLVSVQKPLRVSNAIQKKRMPVVQNTPALRLAPVSNPPSPARHFNKTPAIRKTLQTSPKLQKNSVQKKSHVKPSTRLQLKQPVIQKSTPAKQQSNSPPRRRIHHPPHLNLEKVFKKPVKPTSPVLKLHHAPQLPKKGVSPSSDLSRRLHQVSRARQTIRRQVAKGQIRFTAIQRHQTAVQKLQQSFRRPPAPTSPQRMVVGLESAPVPLQPAPRKFRQVQTLQRPTVVAMNNESEYPKPRAETSKSFAKSSAPTKQTPATRINVETIAELKQQGFRHTDPGYQQLAQLSVDQLKRNELQLRRLEPNGFEFEYGPYNTSARSVLLANPTALIEIVKAVGPNDYISIHDHLPETIRALGPEFTIQTLNELAQITKNAGRDQHTVLAAMPDIIYALREMSQWIPAPGRLRIPFKEIGTHITDILKTKLDYASQIVQNLPATINALGNHLTPETLKEVTEIAKAVGHTPNMLQYRLPTIINALGNHLTPETIKETGKQITEITKVAGNNASDTLQYSLPAFINALGNHLTPETLKKAGKQITEITKVAGNDTSYTLENALPETINALGNHLTPETLTEVVEIAKATGNNASNILENALPATINALGNRLTPETLKEVTEITKAAGNNASNILENALPATINALGNRLTTAYLRKFRVITGTHEGVLRNSVFSIATLSQEQIIEVMDNFDSIQQRATEITRGATIQNSATDRLIVRSMMGVDDPDYRFSEAKTAFESRWNEWINKSISPAIRVANKSFVVSGDFEVTDTRLVKGRTLDTAFVSSLNRRLLTPSENLEATILTQLAARTQLQFDGSFNQTQRNELVANALQKTAQNPIEFDATLRMALPLLPSVFGMTFERLPEQAGLEQTQSFLRDAKMFFETHLPETLQTGGIEPAMAQRVATVFSATRIAAELNKFAKNRSSDQVTIRLEATKDIRDAFYDALGQNCITQYGFELDRPDFQPIRMVNAQNEEQLGVVYALKATIRGQPSMLLAGVEPQKRVAYAVRMNRFMNGLFDRLQAAAIENGLTGGVYSAAAQETNGNFLTTNEEGQTVLADDGRIAQYDVTRAGIQKEVKEFLTLSTNEQVQFPNNFTISTRTGEKKRSPIKYCCKLR